MATTRIQNNEIRAPFFGDKISFITGLDPLGLQNPSSRAYSYLLNGLNVVSRRIRNYSFYCWLLDEFSKKVTSRDSEKQKEFFRKAEYIIALSAVINGVDGINGSNYASKKLETEGDDLILSEGIYNSDRSTEGTYWKFRFGIFGQYYLGSMRQIRIIEEIADEFLNPLGIYRISRESEPNFVTGEKLAKAFAKNIPAKKRLLFLSCIEQNKINRDQLEKLFPDFNMFLIPQDSEENKLLIKMAMQADDPNITLEDASFNRRQSFIYVLRYADQNPQDLQEHNFTRFAYHQKGLIEDRIDETLFGWYYYQLNEFFRLSCTACLNGILNRLEEESGWIHLFDLVEVSVEETIKEFSLTHNVIVEAPISKILEIDFDLEESLCEEMLAGKKWTSISFAIQLLFKLYQENKGYFERLYEYVSERGINSEVDVLSFFILDFHRYQDLSFNQFLKSFLIDHIIYRHRNVAYRKMVGYQSTEKFLFEDNFLRHIGNFAPDYTASRIGTIISFLYDLHLIDEENNLTTFGKNLLSSNNDY